jgi:hypothetical protein
MAATNALSVDGTWWSPEGQRGIWDPRINFAYQASERVKDISVLYQAVTGNLPTLVEMNTWATSTYSSKEFGQIAYDYFKSNLLLQMPTVEGQIHQLVAKVWGKTADASEIQAGVNYLQQGGTWGDGLLYLARQPEITSKMLNTSGQIKLTQDITLRETGWSANAGDNQLSGGTGNDVLVVGNGSDTVNGGEGTDLVVFSGMPENWKIGLNAADQYVVKHTISAQTTLVSQVELWQFGNKIYGDIKADAPKLLAGGESYGIDDLLSPATAEQIKLIGVENWVTG